MSPINSSNSGDKSSETSPRQDDKEDIPVIEGELYKDNRHGPFKRYTRLFKFYKNGLVKYYSDKSDFRKSFNLSHESECKKIDNS